MNYQNEQSNQNYQTQGIVGCPLEGRGSAATLSLGRKALNYLKRESKNILFPLGTSAFLSACLLDQFLFHLFDWTFGWSPPVCCFPNSAKAAAFPRLEKSHLTHQAQGRAGREPSWLWDTEPIHTNRPNLLHPCQPPKSFHFSSCFHISMWTNN